MGGSQSMFKNCQAKKKAATVHDPNDDIGGAMFDAGGSEVQKMSTSYSELTVIMVDPISTGFMCAKRLTEYGVNVILVWSVVCTGDIRTLIPPNQKPIKWSHEFDEEEISVLKKKISAVAPNIHAVYIGSEPGVILGEKLADAFNVRGNDISTSYIRRNKFHQQEACRKAGLDHIQCKLAYEKEDVDTFLKEMKLKQGPFAAVVKPTEGSGTVGVRKCDSEDEVYQAFSATLQELNAFGFSNEGALLQEFLVGTEYVVDVVTMNGLHKVTAVYRYDKRVYMGKPFMYFASILLQPDEEPVPALMKYALDVVTAIDVKNGCVHMEVIMTPRGPVLVETNCRMHGGEGASCEVAERCIGESQMTIYTDCLLNPLEFDKVPAVYSPKKFGCTCHLRSPKTGIVQAYNEEVLSQIKALDSFQTDYLFRKPGDSIVKTEDNTTASGKLVLVNKNKKQLLLDYEKVNSLNDNIYVISDPSTYLDAHE